MYYKRKTLKQHDKHAKKCDKAGTCDFCNEEMMKSRSIYETPYCYVIPNRIPYEVWELRNVTSHLLIIPKEHAMTLKDLTPEAKVDIMNVFAKYESEHYNIYARSPSSITRSVLHQHTHLIKAENKIARGTLTVMKPYLFIKF